MKTLVFNENSWHYTIAKFGGFRHSTDHDLCTYTQRFTKGVFKALFFGVAIAFFGYILSEFLLGVAFSLMTWTYMMSYVGEVVGSIFFTILGAVAFMTVLTWLELLFREAQNTKKSKPDGFIKNAYGGWKDKFCVKIEITH